MPESFSLSKGRELCDIEKKKNQSEKINKYSMKTPLFFPRCTQIPYKH